MSRKGVTMKVYLIRRFETKAILGIFWSANLENLWWELDEIGEPCQYEYTILDCGWIAFEEEEPTPVNADTLSAEAREALDDNWFSWAGAGYSDTLSEAIHQPDRRKWRRFPHATEPGSGVHRLVRHASERADA